MGNPYEPLDERPITQDATSREQSARLMPTYTPPQVGTTLVVNGVPYTVLAAEDSVVRLEQRPVAEDDELLYRVFARNRDQLLEDTGAVVSAQGQPAADLWVCTLCFGCAAFMSDRPRFQAECQVCTAAMSRKMLARTQIGRILECMLARVFRCSMCMAYCFLSSSFVRCITERDLMSLGYARPVVCPFCKAEASVTRTVTPIIQPDAQQLTWTTIDHPFRRDVLAFRKRRADAAQAARLGRGPQPRDEVPGASEKDPYKIQI